MDPELEGVEDVSLHQNDLFLLKLPMSSVFQNLVHVDRNYIFVLRTDEDGNQPKDVELRFLYLDALSLLCFKISVHQ